MERWEEFEIECTNYLNNEFNEFARFIHRGKSDSTVSDIEVYTNKGLHFFIEAKECPAQCSQFVAIPDKEKKEFVFSDLNKNKSNQFSEIILEHMNNEFDKYLHAGTGGETITFNGDKEVFSSWICSTYTEKGTEFFITNDYSLVMLEDINDAFDIEAKYRIKKSGSSAVPRKYYTVVKDYIQEKMPQVETGTIDNELIAISNENIDKTIFWAEKNEYMFSKKENNIYRIRKLSKTFNANVIFTLSLKSDKKIVSVEEFTNYLKMTKKELKK